MTPEKHITNKAFVITAIIGSFFVMAVMIISTLWASKKTASATDEAVSEVSSFYLEAMADRRAKTITNLIGNNLTSMEKALEIMGEEEIDSQEELRYSIGKIKRLLTLSSFAVVDEDDVVYTQYTTYTGRSRHEYLSAGQMADRVIRTVYLYGSSRQLCLAIPADNLTIMGKPFKACFVQIDIKEITDLLAFDDQGRTWFGIYAGNGGNLSNTDLGEIIGRNNLLDETKNLISNSEWEKLCGDFEEGKEGSLTFSANGIEETLCYVPVPDTGWMMTVLISQSVIHDQIRSISESSLSTSRIQIAITFASILLFAIVLLFMLGRISKVRLEAEMENSRLFQSMANTDSLTGVRNKHAFLEYEKLLDQMIAENDIDRLVVAVCDINGLKIVNDTQGHAAGDQLIKDASELICEHFIHGSVYRIGGDEFVVILQGKGYDSFEASFGTINREVEANIERGKVVVSIGYSTLNADDDKLHDVFERADKMMYERKIQLKKMGAMTREG